MRSHILTNILLTYSKRLVWAGLHCYMQLHELCTEIKYKKKTLMIMTTAAMMIMITVAETITTMKMIMSITDLKRRMLQKSITCNSRSAKTTHGYISLSLSLPPPLSLYTYPRMASKVNLLHVSLFIVHCAKQNNLNNQTAALDC